MISKWETEKERIIKAMKISPKKKLEWLKDMHDFLCKTLTKEQRFLFYKLRETR
jgi:hypothetical protein